MRGKEGMKSERKSTTIVGILFIVATLTSILGYQVILSPILNAADYLTAVAENDTQVIFGVLIDSINTIVVVVIAVMLYPIFRKYSAASAVGYVSSRIIEAAILIIGSISVLTLVTLSQEYVQAGTPDASYFLPSGTLLLAVDEWAFLLGPGVAFAISALILNSIFYQSKLVPRFISVWGLIGAILLLAADLLAMFGLSTTSTIFMLLILPIGLNEMVLAVWLIVKGFNSAAIASLSAQTKINKV